MAGRGWRRASGGPRAEGEGAGLAEFGAGGVRGASSGGEVGGEGGTYRTPMRSSGRSAVGMVGSIRSVQYVGSLRVRGKDEGRRQRCCSRCGGKSGAAASSRRIAPDRKPMIAPERLGDSFTQSQRTLMSLGTALPNDPLPVQPTERREAPPLELRVCTQAGRVCSDVVPQAGSKSV